MKRIFFIIIAIFLSPLFSAGQSAGRNLPELWKKWLSEEVSCIITDKEREIFLTLQSDTDRDTFRRGFWAQRDPTPGTPTNEFREEHYKRLRYATEHFGRGNVKLGWETDQGRIYIILGPPNEIQRYSETTANLTPTELWQYYGDTSLGLPPAFYILFYQDMGLGDYKLYSPLSDGPQRLIRGLTQTPDRLDAYQQIRRVSAELAEASLNLIPGTASDPSVQMTSLSSEHLINEIRNLPGKKVKSEWAEAFFRHKDVVTTDYSIGFVPCDHLLFVHQENNQNYLHTVIEPSALSMNQYDDKVFASLKLNVKISSPAEEIIHQEEKSFPIEMSQEDFKKIEGRLIAVGDIIPFVPGNHKVDLLLQNTNSKEFSSVEQTVLSPSSGAPPALSPILFLFSDEEVTPKAGTVPFLFNGHQLSPNLRRLYARSDDVLTYFEIYNPSPEVPGWTLHQEVRREDKVLAKEEEPVGMQTFFIKKFPLKDNSPGYYRLVVSLVNDAGVEVLKQSNEFSVSHSLLVPRPWNFRKIYPPLVHPYFGVVRALEYLGLKQYDKAIGEIEAYYDGTGASREVAKPLARAYFGKGDYAKVIDILSPLKEVQELEILELLGRSYYAIEDYRNAVVYFKRALVVGGGSVTIINSIGSCYLKINDPGEALKAFEKSLQLSPDQPEIRQWVDRLKKDGNS